ncbi:hypothetical protein [Pantoea sp. BAV 3049]|uniref:hypothetical protein n=1 Tax=Pantoea sp. BAV 3049 TaxID=2654188 RepID=UPI001E438AE4|nr:hypothetical protein [Pantoea sp. BAV 3049]
MKRKAGWQKKTPPLLTRLYCVLLFCCGPIAMTQAAGIPSGFKEETFATSDSAGNFHYFISGEDADKNTTSVLIVMHGHPRDVGNTLSAALQAASGNPAASNIPIIAPLFQVSAAQSVHCHSSGLPATLPDDALWNCHSWLDGGLDISGKLSAFGALDQLVAHLRHRWPSLRQVTLAGFSAGGQFVQHYVAFARPPEGIRMRYVIGDPGSWLYFDKRPVMPDCKTANDWKYGLDNVPEWLKNDVTGARERYRSADISYLEGGNDRGKGRGVYYRILDKSCAANSQGNYRLDRGENYTQYDRDVLKPVRPHQLTVVDGCRHDVRCVFPSPAGRQVLFASSR